MVTINAKFAAIIFILCIIIGGIGYRCTFPCTNNDIMWTDTVYVSTVSFDTIIQIKPVPVKITEYKTIIDTVWMTLPVDTTEILTDYHRIRFYDDVLKDDSAGYVRLKESVSQNVLFDRVLYFESRCEDKIITNTISPTGLYAIGGAGWGTGAPIISVGVLYQNDKMRLKGLEVGYFYKPYIKLNYGFRF